METLYTKRRTDQPAPPLAGHLAASLVPPAPSGCPRTPNPKFARSPAYRRFVVHLIPYLGAIRSRLGEASAVGCRPRRRSGRGKRRPLLKPRNDPLDEAGSQLLGAVDDHRDPLLCHASVHHLYRPELADIAGRGGDEAT